VKDPTVGDEVTFPGGHGNVIRTDAVQNEEKLLYIFEAPGIIYKYPSSVEIVRAK